MKNKNQTLVILGSQYGDEGKGKFADLLSYEYDYIVRYQGGDNAGHTIVFNHKTYKLRLIPSGIFNKKNQVIIANGAVINVKTLLEEIKMLKREKVSVSNLHISDRAHLIFEYHVQMDKMNEEIKSKNKIGTTLKGIGPCYSDKANRIGIRVCDLFNKEVLENKIKMALQYKNILFKEFGFKPFNVKKMTNEYYAYGQKIKSLVIDSIDVLNKAYDSKKRILLEGAQGVFLDIDFGTYPYVTSSSVIGLITEGTGLAITKFQDVLGIVKAYSTRVGEGTFVSEIEEEKLVNEIREKGREFGTVTKRPRRIGWLDLVLLKYSIRVAGINQIALTLIDVLSGQKTIKLCTGYTLNKRKTDTIPSLITDYSNCKPVYKTLPGWSEDITKANSFSSLPKNCQDYITFIENFLNVKVTYISVGPDRKQTIEVK